MLSKKDDQIAHLIEQAQQWVDARVIHPFDGKEREIDPELNMCVYSRLKQTFLSTQIGRHLIFMELSTEHYQG